MRSQRIGVKRGRFVTSWRRTLTAVAAFGLLGPLAVGCPLSAMRSQVQAAAIIFGTRAEFEATETTVSEIGFEESFGTSASLQFAGFRVTENSAGSFLSSRTDYVSEGQRSLGFTWNGDGYLEFAFEQPIYSFATDILDFGTCCGALGLQVVDETGQIDVTAAIGDALPRGNVQFFGVTTDQPFRTLRFSSDTVSDNDLITFDRLLFRSVPEPSSSGFAMLAAVVVAFEKLRRRLVADRAKALHGNGN